MQLACKTSMTAHLWRVKLIFRHTPSGGLNPPPAWASQFSTWKNLLCTPHPACSLLQAVSCSSSCNCWQRQCGYVTTRTMRGDTSSQQKRSESYVEPHERWPSRAQHKRYASQRLQSYSTKADQRCSPRRQASDDKYARCILPCMTSDYTSFILSTINLTVGSRLRACCNILLQSECETPTFCGCGSFGGSVEGSGINIHCYSPGAY